MIDDSSPAQSGDETASVEEMKEEIIPHLQDFYQVSDVTVELLEDLRRFDLRGEYESLQSELEKFATSHPDAFRFIVNAITGTEEYLEALEEINGEFDQDVVEDFKEISEIYGHLTGEVGVVYMKTINNYMNPVTGYETASTYSQLTNEPLVYYQVNSGGVTVFETQNGPSISVHFARTIINSVSAAIDSASKNNEEIDPDEIEQLSEAIEATVEEIETLKTLVEEE